MQITKQVNSLMIPRENFARENPSMIRKEVFAGFDSLMENVFYREKSDDESPWMKVVRENESLFYSKEHHLLLPDPERYGAKISVRSETQVSNLNMKFCGFSGSILNYIKVREIFFRDQESPYYRKYKNVLCLWKGGKPSYTDGNLTKEVKDIVGSVSVHLLPAYFLEKALTIEELFLKYNLLPEGLGSEQKLLFRTLKKLYEMDYVKIDRKVEFKKKLNPDEREIIDKVFEEIWESIKQTYAKQGKEKTLSVAEKDKGAVIKYYLESDRIRADMELYDAKRLEDPNLGHWELWNIDSNHEDVVKTDQTYVARNPLADIREDCVVGIDFGTKSTIVVYQDAKDNTQPMRIGIGRWSREAKASDFENPTVMELINLEEFLSRYASSEGRPFTRWKDLTISHTANNR